MSVCHQRVLLSRSDVTQLLFYSASVFLSRFFDSTLSSSESSNDLPEFKPFKTKLSFNPPKIRKKVLSTGKNFSF